MANPFLQRVLRNQSQSTLGKIFIQHGKPSPLLLNQIPKLSQPTESKPDNYSKPTDFTHFYPTFSFGNFLNPNLQPSLIRPQMDGEEEEDDDDSKTIRADSVKKKRKKKMNKHKLRKLKKRLRRKTKT